MKVGSGSFGIYPYIEGKSIASQLNSACAQAAGEGTRTLNSGFGNAGSSVGSTFANGFKNAISGIGKIATAAVGAGAAGVTALVKSAVSSFAEYEQLVGGVETIFKDSADTVKRYADEAYKTAGMNANEYMDTVVKFSASLLQGLGGDTAKAAEIANIAIIDMGDNANKMGTALESIQWAYQGFAKQNYTMLDWHNSSTKTSWKRWNPKRRDVGNTVLSSYIKRKCNDYRKHAITLRKRVEYIQVDGSARKLVLA